MEQHVVKAIKEVKPYTLTLEFNTGEILDVNLEAKLHEWSNDQESIYKQLLDPEYFVTVKYEKDWETVCWDNGVDFCADVLYQIAKEKPQEKNENDIIKAILLLYRTLNPELKKSTMQRLKQITPDIT